jgi:hypothetical protein
MTTGEQVKELGQALVPFLVLHYAVTLAAARLGNGSYEMTHSSESRQRILDECIADAQYLVKVI